ncbi:hypothetical protein OE903_20650 [Bacillus sp. B6(2022)]|nr:hypothetical protein [Bacillus sp. B6(2022)]
MTKTIKQTGPYQAVHAHTDFQTGFSALAAKLAGVKIRICHSHNTAWKQSPSRVDHLLLKGFRQLIFAFSTQLVACGEDAGVFLFGQKECTMDEWTFYQMGLIWTFFSVGARSEGEDEKDLHLHERKLIIGHIGRFHEQKNHVFSSN